MSAEFETALRRHIQWFGSYTKSGELKKTPVWLTLNTGFIEFITHGESFKVRRVMRQPRVVCYIGSADGPAVPGQAEIITEPESIHRVYRAYWKTHPFMMLLLGIPIKRRIKAAKQVLIRVRPDEPNPFDRATDPSH